MECIILTQSQVNQMTKAQRLTELNRLQDRACNIDYLKRPLTYEAIARNINILEQKILYKEY